MKPKLKENLRWVLSWIFPTRKLVTQEEICRAYKWGSMINENRVNSRAIERRIKESMR